MSNAATAATPLPTCDGQACKTTATSSQIILAGMIKLLDGQRRFAEELGLPYAHVFHEECQEFRNKNPELVLREWLRDKIEGPEKFRQLINDLVEHNLALCAALDGVALESIARLSPSNIKTGCINIFGWRPFAWFKFRRLHKAYTTNDYLRHHELVVRGFAKAYCTHRKSLRNATQPCCPLPKAQTNKEKT
ncbi:hypothetical protein Pcar_2807 [Syntrophotalea carbinolica DSM 2380]|uniref:Type VI secretion system FHA domain-containing protein n=1 Tax=Syntrophotalea carbinolica (strain DSM 2380 / NBRC 103641 / GraBd1) TaxID=338963 RepID=Q3A0R5_SYNC1|nr:type VI secretion system-associated FHA domain protein [Syntrophotalea carbinolica]ABA90042.1 hypothetical protein Pcar_2807 [Syntrophotalea carbinolica DSM 2380]